MAQQVNDVIDLCCKIADQPEFKNTWTKVAIGSTIAATGAGAGGLLLGPIGFAVGGSAGSFIATLVTSGEFDSLPQILKELPHAEKQKLYNDVVAVLGNLTWTGADQLVSMVMGNADRRQRVTDVLLNYIKEKD